MAERQKIGSDNAFKAIIICSLMITAFAAALLFRWKQQPSAPAKEKLPEKRLSESRITRKVPPLMDFGKLDKDPVFADMMQSRKEEYGLDDSLDMIVKSDEHIQIGDITVPMQEIAEKILMKEKELAEKEPADKSEPVPTASASEDRASEKKEASRETRHFPVSRFEMSLANGKKEDVYGIYVVQTADNVWNIHFGFLKEYFDKRKISLSRVADEPSSRGRSSGVGKLLKFSEQMVYIYNLEEHRLDSNLNLIHPLSKIVVFDLGKAFSLLKQIDCKNINRIRFDGEKIRFPSQ